MSYTSPYQLETNFASVDVKRGSSLNIYDILKDASVNKSVELYTDCDMDHGIGSIGTYFGIDNQTEADVRKYIVQRAATFFQAIMNGIDTSLGQDKFEDQENKRVKCNTNDNVESPKSCTLEE